MGWLRRVRRSWLVSNKCDKDVLAAINAGARLSCLSEAKRLNLWVPNFSGLHVSLIANAGQTLVRNHRRHWGRRVIELGTSEPFEHLYNVLEHIANCVDEPQALAVWESAVEQKLVTTDQVALVKWKTPRARELALNSGGLSESGLESLIRYLLLQLGVPFEQQVWINNRRLDALIDKRLVIEADGRAYHRSVQQLDRDHRADNELKMQGYTVLRFGYLQIVKDPESVLRTIRTALAQGLHL